MLAVFSDERFAEATRVNIELWPEILRNERLAQNLRDDLSFWKEIVSGIIREAQELGELRPEVDARMVSLLMISAFEGLRHYHLIDPEFSERVLLDAFGPLMGSQALTWGEAIPGGEDVEVIGPPIGMPKRGGERDA
jgi:hypothetical protein